MSPKFELGRDFCTSFIILYVYSFGSDRVYKPTNKHTPLKTSKVLRYATTLGDHKLTGYDCHCVSVGMDVHDRMCFVMKIIEQRVKSDIACSYSHS